MAPEPGKGALLSHDGNFLAQERSALGPLGESAQNAIAKIWYEQDSRSLIHIAPDCVKRAMLELPEEMKLLTDGEIRKIGRLTPVDNQLRLSFWLEYERVQAKLLPRMETNQIVRGIVSDDYFTQAYLKNNLRVAWLLTPPTSYVAKLSEAVDFGLERVREILELDITDPKTGKVNSAVAKLILQATMLLDARKHGAVTQRIESTNRSMTVSVHAGADNVQQAIEDMNMSQIEQRLKQLERREALLERGQVIDVESESSVMDEDRFAGKRGQMSDEDWAKVGTVNHEQDPGTQGSGPGEG